METLLEGGNIFKDASGKSLTRRIDQQEIPGTVAWLEQITGLSLPRSDNDHEENTWLGSTGKNPTSGDLDLRVNQNVTSKEELVATLSQWVTEQGKDPAKFLKKAGISVHFFTPINGRSKNGWVQTDFMFTKNPQWTSWAMSNDPKSSYKGETRAIMINSLGKAMGYKINQNSGMHSRSTNELVTDDPTRVAKTLLNPSATMADMYSVEAMLSALKNDPKKEAKIADFRDYMEKAGTPLQEPVAENTELNFLSRLRDRIVNQGMMPLVETERNNVVLITEAEAAGVGGRAKGIEHLEDLVFRQGTKGIQTALDIVAHAAESPGKTTTVKWDGMPAVIFGRKPATGEFVLTDGSGFDAKGYDGLATSPKMMAQIQNTRKGDRTELIQTYADLFPKLDSALPTGFRGYVKGDLLYYPSKPWVEKSGNYVFKPNTVLYKIPAKSALGQRIGASDTGIAMHTMYADVGAARQPLSRVGFNQVPGLLLIDPSTSVPKTIELDPVLIKQLKDIIRVSGRDIDVLFNPAELRAHQITDLARLCVDFINTKVGNTLNGGSLMAEFGTWLQAKVSPRKFANIVEYLRSPTSNTSALAAAFTAFIILHDLKTDILQQLDLQHPGQEGWVMATPAGYAKAVGRFTPGAFASQNRIRNNPEQA